MFRILGAGGGAMNESLSHSFQSEALGKKLRAVRLIQDLCLEADAQSFGADLSKAGASHPFCSCKLYL